MMSTTTIVWSLFQVVKLWRCWWCKSYPDWLVVAVVLVYVNVGGKFLGKSQVVLTCNCNLNQCHMLCAQWICWVKFCLRFLSIDLIWFCFVFAKVVGSICWVHSMTIPSLVIESLLPVWSQFEVTNDGFKLNRLLLIGEVYFSQLHCHLTLSR